MLVLSRKKNESIVINNDITIVVVDIRGDKVRLGVEAPKEVPVHRREVFDLIKQNEAKALEEATRAEATRAEATSEEATSEEATSEEATSETESTEENS
jgi:carbon storage regulator